MTKYSAAQQAINDLIGELGENHENLALKAMAIREQLDLMSMDKILAKVPGDDVTDQCRYIGVSRQTYYYWLRGVCRPNAKQAKRLAHLTGYDVHDIRGKFRISPPR